MKSERELVSFLGRKIDQSLNDEDGDISDVRSKNFNLYVGKPFGNEREGYSSVVTREALETIEWAMPAVLRVFAGDDRFAEYDAVGPEDEGEAEQQTDIAKYYLMKRNNGFLTLHHWVKDIMMYPNGYTKLCVEECEKTAVEHYRNLTLMGLQQTLMTLGQKGETEILEQESMIVPGPQGPEEVYEIRIRVTWKDRQIKWLSVPPDEMLVDNDCLSIDLDDADFLCHRVRKTFTQLVNEGYSADQLERVGEGEDYQWLDERTNRLFHEDEDPDGESEDDPSMRTFWVHECYCYVDFDGDGLAEFRRVVMIGAEIFENEETDYQPFVAAAAILIPHKHAGLSYIDVVKDLQEIKSTLWRQLLDNIYKLNVRRKYIGDAFISDEADTLGVLMDTMSEFIPARDPTAIQEELVQPIVGDILPVIQGMNDLQAVRTGITPDLSLDPNVLQQSTEGAFRHALEQASERVEMLVRVFAETGMRALMIKMHQLMREYMDKPTALKLRGEWVEFNPSTWRERDNVTVNVGLGHHKKDHKLMLLRELLMIQKEAMMGNLSDPSLIYNTLDDLVETAGLGHTTRFFVDPTQPGWQPPQPQPDPMIELAAQDLQIKAQGQQAEQQLKAQAEQRDFMIAQAKIRQDYEEMMMKYGDMQMRVAELEAKIRQTNAQTEKTLEEAQGQSIENNEIVREVQRTTQAN